MLAAPRECADVPSLAINCFLSENDSTAIFDLRCKRSLAPAPPTLLGRTPACAVRTPNPPPKCPRPAVQSFPRRPGRVRLKKSEGNFQRGYVCPPMQMLPPGILLSLLAEVCYCRRLLRSDIVQSMFASCLIGGTGVTTIVSKCPLRKTRPLVL